MFKKNYLFFAMEKDAAQEGFVKISSVMADDEFKTTDTFCSYFDSNNLDETTEVLSGFVKNINASTILVSWSRGAYFDFVALLKNAKIRMAKSKVVFLKSTLGSFIKEQYSFEKILRKTELYNYDKPLGQDTNDVKYLKELYKIFLTSYQIREGKKEIEFCIAKGSNILHDKDCHHVRRAKEVNAATPEVLFEGYTYCKHCEKKHALRAYGIEANITQLSYGSFIEKVYELCASHSIDCNILGNIAYLNTGRTHWRMVLNKKNKVSELLHENYNAFKFYKNSPGDMKFHKQHINENDVESVIEYIYNHDKKPLKVLAPRKKVSRMEYLFSIIESGKQPVSAYAM